VVPGLGRRSIYLFTDPPQEITMPVQYVQHAQHMGAHAPYQRPRLERHGTFREVTRQGFSGNMDGGLILGPDGSATPGGDEGFQGGSR
jgi:hypothetical protein